MADRLVFSAEQGFPLAWSNSQTQHTPFLEQALRMILLYLALLAPSLFAGCSMQQVYNTGQAWQQNQCLKIIDAQERSRCMASTGTSYDEYKRESSAVGGQK
jgi:hypothetical protein